MFDYIMNMLRSGQNPQQIAMNFLQNKQNPMMNNLVQLAQQGNVQELERIARNITKEQGKDFDTEFRAFRQKFGSFK